MMSKQNKIIHGKEVLELYLSGREKWNQWALENPHTDVDFSDVDTSKLAESRNIVDFERFIFPPMGGVYFCDMNFITAVDFSGAKFGRGEVYFESTIFGNGVWFSKAQFTGKKTTFYKTQFSKHDADFSHVNFGGGDIDFNEAVFSKCKVSFKNSNFGKGNVSFQSTKFDSDEVFFTGAIFREGNLNFSGSIFSGSRIDFSNFEVGKGFVHFNQCNFTKGDIFFIKAKFGDGNVSFYNAKFGDGNVSFEEARFSSGRINFSNCHFGVGNLSFRQAIFDNCEIDFSHIKKHNIDLSGTNLTRSDFTESDLTGANLSGATLSESNFTDTVLRKVTFDEKTRLDSLSQVVNVKIDKSSIDNLANDKGGLHLSQFKKMKIFNDLATLQLTFSGFWRVIHSISLLVFLFPYVFFLFKCWAISEGANWFEISFDLKNSTIGEKLWEYIYTMGKLNGAVSPWIFFSVALVLYNLSRILLLYKTISLEHQQTVTGLPSDFNMDRYWSAVYLIANRGIYLYLIFSIVHFCIFLSRPIV